MGGGMRGDTVEGRNSAPAEMVNNQLFIHVRWCRISSINSIRMR